MNKLDPDVLSAVLEAYTPEGVVIWLTNWFHADPQRVARMEAGVKTVWSGQWPDNPASVPPCQPDCTEHLHAGDGVPVGFKPGAHDHRGEPKVWCETHQHTHVASIPRFTYLCKSCGWGQWYKPDAEAHEASCAGHETYEVEHVVGPLPEPARLSAQPNEGDNRG